MAPANSGGYISKSPKSDFWFVEVMLQFFNSIISVNGGQCRFCQLFLAPIYLPYYRNYTSLKAANGDTEKSCTRREEQLLLLSVTSSFGIPAEDTPSGRVIYAADKFRNSYEDPIYRYLGKNESFNAPKRFLSVFSGGGEPIAEARKAHDVIVKYYTGLLEFIFENSRVELENRTNNALKKIMDFHETVVPNDISNDVFSKAAWVLSSALVLTAVNKSNLRSSENGQILKALFDWPDSDTIAYSDTSVKLQLHTSQLIGLLKCVKISAVELETIRTMLICVETALTQEAKHPEIPTLIRDLDKKVTEMVTRKALELKDSPTILNTEKEQFDALRELQESLERIKKIEKAAI